MAYTVKEIAVLTGVTIKTLHHYHKIGLLVPYETTTAGYRLYDTKDLERLQQILFYRELDFSLKDIKKALDDEPGRVSCLIEQQELLHARRQRLDRLLVTIEESIILAKGGKTMDSSSMFKGLNKQEWAAALAEQNEHLKEQYGYDMLKSTEINADQMNEQASEAQSFMNFMANALKNGWKADDPRVKIALDQHIAFLNSHGHKTDADSFLAVTKFFLNDDFHRNMLEGQQTGLSYYLFAAAELYAVRS